MRGAERNVADHAAGIFTILVCTCKDSVGKHINIIIFNFVCLKNMHDRVLDAVDFGTIPKQCIADFHGESQNFLGYSHLDVRLSDNKMSI